MKGNDATIEVHGPAAREVAKSVIESLGVDAGDVTEIRVALTTENGEQTTTDFISTGPQAGRIARSMVGAIDHDETPPSSIEVELETSPGENSTDDSGGGGGDNGEEEGGDSAPQPDNGEVLDVRKNVEGGRETETLTPLTDPHAALTAVAAYYAKVTTPGDGDSDPGGDEHDSPVRGVSVKQLYRCVDVDMDRRVLSRALARAANRNKVLVKHQVDYRNRGTVNYYELNDVGLAFLAKHGGHSGVGGDIGPTLDGVEDPAEHPYKSLREKMAGNSRDVEDGRDIHKTHHSEPRVDEPKELSPDTRYHECLWTLKEWHDEHGDDDWATAKELLSSTQFDFPSESAFGTPLSHLFLERALTERRTRHTEGPGVPTEHRLNDAGWEEVERLGPPAGAE